MKKKRPHNLFWILLIFMVCAYGFWQNAQNQYSAIVRQEVTQIDETNTLSDEDVRYLQRYQKEFEAKFEIRLIIKIVKDIKSVTRPEHPSYLYLAIAPRSGEAVIHASTLVNALLGHKIIDTYNEQYLQPQLKKGNWQTGLQQFLNAISNHIAGRLQEPPDSPPAG